jgi:hypothetical protein
MKPHTLEMRQAAERYAASEKSDPWAYARALTHIRNGVASYTDQHGRSAFYSADEGNEPRAIKMPNGQVLEWQAVVYRNMIRP